MTTNIANLTGDVVLAAGEMLAVDLASGGHWYGHGFSHVQPFPLETGEVGIENADFAVNNIRCPVWMCSAGVVLYAETVAPLEVAINHDGDGCLRQRCPSEDVPLRVFRGASLPAAHAPWLKHIGWPNQAPDAALFEELAPNRCETRTAWLSQSRSIIWREGGKDSHWGLDEGITERDVILPPGEWLDAWTGEAVCGVQRQWPAPCPGIPLFVQARNHGLLAKLHDALGEIRRGTISSGITSATWQAGLNRDLNVTG